MTTVPAGRWREAVAAGREDRTALRDVRAPLSSPRWGDVEVRTWPTRAAMARVIRREDRAAPSPYRWQPVVALAATEGYDDDRA